MLTFYGCCSLPLFGFSVNTMMSFFCPFGIWVQAKNCECAGTIRMGNDHEDRYIRQRCQIVAVTMKWLWITKHFVPPHDQSVCTANANISTCIIRIVTNSLAGWRRVERLVSYVEDSSLERTNGFMHFLINLFLSSPFPYPDRSPRMLNAFHRQIAVIYSLSDVELAKLFVFREHRL